MVRSTRSTSWPDVIRRNVSLLEIGQKEEYMRSEHMLRLRYVAPEGLLSEEEVSQKDPQNLFLGPGNRPEPSRSNYIAYVRLEPSCKVSRGMSR